MTPWEISPEEERASFEVLRVDDLPPIERSDIAIEPHETSPCGCDYCQAEWRQIADASVAILEAGIDPLDEKAVLDRGRALGLADTELVWLGTLFRPTIAITVLRDSRQFTNGMHRTHALRLAGAERVVVYTGRGEKPYMPGS